MFKYLTNISYKHIYETYFFSWNTLSFLSSFLSSSVFFFFLLNIGGDGGSSSEGGTGAGKKFF